ncbi:MAG: hypothetical protein IJU16_03535 [Clostridia bacterium]|nr:hypothetical protein [Clostridia bacterium]
MEIDQKYKERLTTAAIRAEAAACQKQCLNMIFRYIVAFLLASILLWAVAMLFFFEMPIAGTLLCLFVFAVPSLALWILVLISFIIEMIRYHRCRAIARGGDFQLIADTLVEIELHYTRRLKSHKSISVALPPLSPHHQSFYYVFRFARSRRFPLQEEQDYYPWSERFSLDEAGMLMYSEIGDTFYIVTTADKKALFFFNSRLFKLSDELPLDEAG